jgi:serine/threonine-protein kinase
MEQIGRYQIRGELGRGGMSIVYHAYDPRFRRDVAVKVLPREFLHDPQFRGRFEQEARTIASLEHPAIVPVHDFGDANGQLFLVMRLMLGGTLRRRLNESPIPLGEIARILERLAPALDAAHTAGIVHRDLKPDNILFDQWDKPYIADFGIVKLVQESRVALTATGGLVGTPAYMSPEQWQGKKLDSRSDIYALGIILFQMLTGKQPYDADTPPAMGYLHVHEPVPLLFDTNPKLSPACQEVVDKAMAKSPEKRPLTATALANAISDLAGWEASSMRASIESRQTVLDLMSEVDEAGASERMAHALHAEEEEVLEQPPEVLAEPAWPRETELLPPSLQDSVPTPDRRTPIASKDAAVPDRPARSVTAAPEGTLRRVPVWGWGIAGVFILLAVILGLGRVLGGDEEQSARPIPATMATPIPDPNGPPALAALKDTWLRPADGMEMVFVPGGSFMMGSDESDPDALSHEKPKHEVGLDSFWLDRVEVTNAQYVQCVNEGVCQASVHADHTFYNGADYPVVGVAWVDAKAYCTWAGGRLPSEAQWEYAARGEDGWAFPWGNESPDCGMAQFSDCSGATMPVGSFSPDGESWVGAADMAGNVWEWVADWYDSNYYAVSQAANPIGPTSGNDAAGKKVLRGGSWVNAPQMARAANRIGTNPYERNGGNGFRCAIVPGG